MKQLAHTTAQLGVKADTTDRRLDDEHRARVQAQHLQETENARILHLIDEEADKIAQEHKERLEHEHIQKVFDKDMLMKIEDEAKEIAREHTSRLEQEHSQQALNDKILQRIADEAEALKAEHLERLESETKQAAVDSAMRVKLRERSRRPRTGAQRKNRARNYAKKSSTHDYNLRFEKKQKNLRENIV